MPRQLAPQHEDRIARMLSSGGFADADEVIGEALALLEQRQRQLQELRAKIQLGLDSGESFEFTPELMDEIERESEEHFLRGELPGPTPVTARASS